ncbi:FUSC family protein [Tessaracoccus caeni]|uniref:FUSC family protein n=1 Tax=Tessaracoccus caeni TaxID=3031239 RepID=UPI0023D9F605|nr:FUSC family protein [Tessaracoccus caeni]MDF1489586.1 FUSC family protein [Tessaracoccus caeni]
MPDNSHHGFSWVASRDAVQKATLRAFDLSERTAKAGWRLSERTAKAGWRLSERTARAGWRSQVKRVRRWRSRLFMILQVSLAAGLAWWFARTVVGHPAPFLATVGAIVCLGASFGQRLGRVVELAIGVTIGVGLGDLFLSVVGTGVWQVMLAVAVAMSVSTWVDGRGLMVTQAAVQAAAVMTVMPGQGAQFNRWIDALIGCAVAVLFATVAPLTPIDKPRLIAASVLHNATQTLRALSSAIRAGDHDATEEVLARARGTEDELQQLLEAAQEGVAVVRTSPFLRRHKQQAVQIADLTVPLDHFMRNLRVLARRGVVSVYHHENVPPEYLQLIDDLAQLTDECAAELFARRIPARMIEPLTELGRRCSEAPVYATISPTVLLAQVRSMVIDLLELCGLDPADAREAVPYHD